ncbi:hypothetical protein ACFL6P_09210 [Candidatus Latescibacterota bacterium]
MSILSDSFKRFKFVSRHVPVIKSLLLTTCLLFCSRIVCAQENNYGPRIEVGIGNGASMMQSNPDWSSGAYYSGTLTYAYRLFYGLSVQGGRSFGVGGSTDTEWYDYGSRYQINAEKGTFSDSSWLGVRYEIPMSMIKKDFKNINTIYVAGGLSWDYFVLRSKSQRLYDTDYGWQSGRPFILQNNEATYKTAEMKSYYVAAAARWQIKTRDTDKDDTWLGSLVFDVGVRYNGFYDAETKFDNIESAHSNFSYFQIFIVASMKVKLFY